MEKTFTVTNNKTNQSRHVIGKIGEYTGKPADLPLYGDNDKPRKKAHIVILSNGQRALLTTPETFQHNIIGDYYRGTIIKYSKQRQGEDTRHFTYESHDKSIYMRRQRINAGQEMTFQRKELKVIDGVRGRQVWLPVGHEMIIPVSTVKKYL